MGALRITVGKRQAEELASEMGSGSESFTEAIELGLTLEGRVLTIPEPARDATAQAIGIRVDIALDNRQDDPWYWQDGASTWEPWRRLGERLDRLGLKGVLA